MSQVFQLKITLKYAKPPIWRRVLVPSDYTLYQLHHVIQTGFAWENCHLYAFKIFDNYFDDETPETDKLTLEKLTLQEKQIFMYTYDFGDSWDHEILIEKRLDKSNKINYPYCVTGKRAAPPEDCGGIGGYEYNLEVLKDNKHPDYEEIKEWMGDEITDPDYFSADDVNQHFKIDNSCQYN